MTSSDTPTRRRGQRTTWAAGLVVAAGAGVATAHGLFRVAAAAQVPTVIGWLYPLITDGLALVAYAATSRLADGGRRYAWTIVAVAAGLSGLAQAVYLAGGIGQTATAPVGLRFGVGAWPALAAALTAHLLHLIATAPDERGSGALTPTSLFHKPDPAVPLANSERSGEGDLVDERPIGRQLTPESFTLGAPSDVTSFVQQAPTRQPATGETPPAPAVVQSGVQPYSPPGVQPSNPAPVQPPRTDPALNAPDVQPPRSTPADPERTRTPEPAGPAVDSGGAAAGDRARHAARAHLVRHGALPTATELMQTAQVSRGTAGTVLKQLRDDRPALHIVNAQPETDPDH